MRGSIVFLTATVLGTALDLGTKRLAELSLKHPSWPLEHRPPVSLIPGFLDLAWNENRGAAFGLLRGKFWIFIAISLVAVAALVYFSAIARKESWRYHATLGVLTAGVFGNLYDRLVFSYVRDFIDMYIGYRPAADKLIDWFGTNHWPTYNFADAFICVGAVSLLVKFWRDDRRERLEAAAAAATGAPDKAKAKAPARG